jgi:cytochrome c peroxidase
VEESYFAGIPPTETCMTCHSQLWTHAEMLAPVRQSLATDTPLRWTRVYDLPDYVYFNHSIHINKGVACVTCHGRVDKMPLIRQANSLYMGWCLECHRAPEKYVRPREHVFDMDWQPPEKQITLGKKLVHDYRIDTSGRITTCYTCHH